MIKNISISDQGLVVLMGIPGSGKSTWAREHFQPSEIVSTDYCRYLITGNEADVSCDREAMAVYYAIISGRLMHKRLTVADGTNVTPESRRLLLGLAKTHGMPTTLIVSGTPMEECMTRNRNRERVVPDFVMETMILRYEQSLSLIQSEVWDHVIQLNPLLSYEVRKVEPTKITL